MDPRVREDDGKGARMSEMVREYWAQCGVGGVHDTPLSQGINEAVISCVFSAGRIHLNW